MIDLSRHRFDGLAEDDECVLYRARSEEDGSEVLVLAPAMQYPSPDVLKRLEHEYSLREELDREWAFNGRSNKEVAQILYISEHTAKAHVGAIMTKLNADSRTEVMAIATRHGLIKAVPG
jgi:DNA-binding CsgD family transcriptional regulator